MRDSVKYVDWFDKAESECEAADILLKHDGNNAVVAFLCQQAIEKAFKGYVLKHNKELLEGHSLIFLCRRAAEIDPRFQAFLKDSAYMNQFYIETRYPADIPLDVTDDDAQKCVGIAKALMDKLIYTEVRGGDMP